MACIIWTNTRFLIIGLLGSNPNEIRIKYNSVYAGKLFWIYRLGYGSHFVSASILVLTPKGQNITNENSIFKRNLLTKMYIKISFHTKVFPMIQSIIQIARFEGPTWGPPGSYRPQMGPILAPWTLLSENIFFIGTRNGLAPAIEHQPVPLDLSNSMVIRIPIVSIVAEVLIRFTLINTRRDNNDLNVSKNRR